MNNINETSETVYRLIDSLEEMSEYLRTSFKDNFVNSFKNIQKEIESMNKITIEDYSKVIKMFESSPLIPSSEEYARIKDTIKEVNAITTVAGTAMSGLGIAVSVVTTAFDLLKGAVNLFFKEYFDSCKNITNGMSDFYSSIDSAGSIFDGFNQLIIDTSDSTEEWKQNLDGVQKTLSELSKKGQDMTNEDQKAFEDNYEMMKEYYEQELKLIEESGIAIQRRAEIAVMTGDLTSDQMQRMVNDAESHKDTMIAKISEQYEEEVLLLAQKYTDEHGVITEEGKKQIEELTKARDEQIQLAHDKCGETLKILTNGYYDQMNLQKMSVEEQDKLNDELKALENNFLNEWLFIIASGNLKESELEEKRLELQKKYDDEEQMIRKKYYENMSDFSDEELSVLVSMCAMTETYGGKMNELTSDYVMNLIDNWDNLPKETKEIMKNALAPMIEEMDKKRTPLFQKAEDMANGILSRLKKAFDIKSPSRKTREIFRFLMEGCELGLEDEKNNLLGITDDISGSVLDRLSNIGDMAGMMHSAVMGSSYNRVQGASVAELNRRATMKGMIHTVLNIDGREFAIATSDYIQEELAFKR